MEDSAANLIAMGFEADKVEQALTICAGNTERAVELLLGGGPLVVDPGASTMANPGATSFIQADISQYSVDSGRSACTCIALTGATMHLREPEVSREMLRNMVLQGVSAYQQMSRAVEHMSAEEVLNQQSPHFPLQILGGVRQGILSNDTDHPMGLKLLLQACQGEGAQVVLITKTPETVVVGLSPQFVLIDSHPRPQLGAENAYAKTHSSLDDLVMCLQAIFPPTELGPDIPEMMAMMYNSFDLYPLGLKPN